MANEVKKLNAIAVGDIKNLNTLTDANIKEFNAQEWSSGPAHVWSSASAMHDSMSGAGGHQIGQVNTAVVVAGGYEGAFTDDTQERNSTTWTTESATISATRQEAGAGGSAPSRVIFGGWPGAGGNTNVTEEYNGTAWSSGGNIPVAKGANRGTGVSQTAMIEALGSVEDGGGKGAGDNASTYNGTSWSTITDPDEPAQYVSSFGESDAAYFCGGYGYPGAMNGVQSWNGSSWTEGSLTLRISQHQQGFSFGSSSAAVLGGGAGATTGTSYGSNKDHADKWNGTAFSATSTVPYGLNDMMGAGSQAAGTAFGGGGGSHVDTCVTYA